MRALFNKQDVVIVDTGCANINSLKFAIEKLGVEVCVSDDARLITSAKRVFLPGVGHVRFAMQALRQKGLDKLIPTLTQPVLGICLGMQLLTKQSKEGSIATQDTSPTNCLGLIDTYVEAMRGDVRLPHMGWNKLKLPTEHPLFAGLKNDEYFYFVHSFAAPLSEFALASCDYPAAFAAVIQHRNFIGVQFHPERSGAAGAKLIQNFLEMDPC